MLKPLSLPFYSDGTEATKKTPTSPTGNATPAAQSDATLQGKHLPKLIINVLNGGKEAGSKVKFSRFYLIIDFNPYELVKLQIQNQEREEGAEMVKYPDIFESYIKFQQAVEKTVGSTKQGLAAFKRGVDGAFFNAYDNINECFKVIEDAINSTGINSEQKKYFKIGINTDAISWFLEEANKYEWDGPKVQYDED